MNHILDDLIRREAQLQRFASFLVREYVTPTSQQLADELPRMLLGYQDLTRTQQRELMARVRQYTRESWGGIWVGVDENWHELMEQEAGFQYDLYDDFAPETLVPLETMPNMNTYPMILNSQAGVWSQFVAGNVDDTIKAVDALVQRGISEGQTVEQMKQQLRGQYNRRTKQYSGGIITGKQANRAESLVRTGVSQHVNAVRDRFAAENDDVIDARIFFATLDSRTTTICLSNHLKRWDIDDDKYPRLPLHFNERSVYIFKTPGFDPLNTTRPTRGGKSEQGTYDVEMIKANVSAEAWLKRQPKWFVEQSLGKERARLFLEGNLKIKSMVDISNRPLTLAQLKETTAGARAYRRAGDE